MATRSKGKSPTTPPAGRGTGDEPRRGFWQSYKPDQGRYARMFTFWSIGFLMLYGATRLAPWLRGKDWNFIKVDGYANNWFDVNLLGEGGRIPILGFQPTYANLIATGLLLAFLYWYYRFLNKPKRADLLIETESEMRKVTWPTWPETWNSTLVVIGTVLFFMVFLAAADWVEATVLNFLLFS